MSAELMLFGWGLVSAVVIIIGLERGWRHLQEQAEKLQRLTDKHFDFTANELEELGDRLDTLSGRFDALQALMLGSDTEPRFTVVDGSLRVVASTTTREAANAARRLLARES